MAWKRRPNRNRASHAEGKMKLTEEFLRHIKTFAVNPDGIYFEHADGTTIIIEFNKLISALKLQELVKEEIETTKQRIESLQDKDTMFEGIIRKINELKSYQKTLQSLVEESEK